MKLTKENIMNEVDHDKVSLAFGLFVISKLSENQVSGLLNEFRDMFFDTIREKGKSLTPDTDDIVVQNHNDVHMEKDVTSSVERNLLDLEKQMIDLSTDKESWKKVFEQELKWY
mgnify:CR=1 FL=1|jgi:hypothetical protein